jgi:glycosyltransferase involved in cell wall biosynthesis
MTRICFFGLDNYRMLNPAATTKPINGEAVQQVLLARAFQDLGYDVSMVVRAGNERIEPVVDGIRVLQAFKWDAGFPVIRFVHPKITGVIRALNEADADIYYQSPAAGATGVTAAFCRWKRRKFIFRVASDVNCIPGQQLIELWRDRKMYEYGLRRADLIAVQSRYQMDLLKRNYGLDSAIVNMVMDPPAEDLEGARDIDVLWVSNLRRVKRAERVLVLAKRLPSFRFVMIGGPTRGEEDYFAHVEQGATGLGNVRFLGQLPYADVNRYFARAKVFLNTSDIEGFPNTFLQAWARRVPVVSFFDPDQTIVREGLGLRPADEEEMIAALTALLGDPVRRARMGEVAQAYADANFSPAAAAKRYIELCPA